MRFEKNNTDSDTIGFDLTPLVDVVFLLIIFFMVTTTYVYQPTIKINLPGSSQPVSVNRNYITITIDSIGNIFLFERRVDNLDELFTTLRREYEKNSDRIVLVRGDRDTRYENIVNVIDTIKRTGLRRVLIATRSNYGR